MFHSWANLCDTGDVINAIISSHAPQSNQIKNSQSKCIFIGTCSATMITTSLYCPFWCLADRNKGDGGIGSEFILHSLYFYDSLWFVILGFTNKKITWLDIK